MKSDLTYKVLVTISIHSGTILTPLGIKQDDQNIQTRDGVWYLDSKIVTNEPCFL